MHGPENIDGYTKFMIAWDAGQLIPVWGSWDNVIADGLHAWDSWDSETRQWVGEDYFYESTSLQ